MYELEVNEENIKKTIETNVLDRNGSIFNFLKLIYSIDKKATISIDGNWGTGKTFFVKQTELIMNLLNNPKGRDLEQNIQSVKDKIKCKLDELGINTYGNTRAIYYNACEYDNCNEPILTLIADIIKNNSDINFEDPKVKEKISVKLNKFLCSFKIGASFQSSNGNTIAFDIQKQSKEDNKPIIENILLDKELEKNFILLLEDLLVEKSNRLVIFIDELDRCNPNFAIKLLERIKNFFNDERFIFVFSINLEQLQYTIKKYYGEGFDGAYYLQKFFDYQLELPEISIDKYIKYQIDYIDININNYFEESIKSVINYMKFNLRDCNKYFQALKLKYDQIKNNRSSGVTNILFLDILFPLLLGIKIKKPEIYLNIKKGNEKKEFYNLLNSCESIKDYFERFIGREKISDLEIYINQLYEFMYVNKKEYEISINKGLNINRDSCNVLNGVLSYLGEKIKL